MPHPFAFSAKGWEAQTRRAEREEQNVSVRDSHPCKVRKDGAPSVVVIPRNLKVGHPPRFISEDPAGFAGGPNFYDYAKNRPTNLIDPTGLFTIRNGIREHDQINIDSVCGPGTGGACTSATALLMCACTKDDCSDKWKAHAELRIYGDMYIYNGPWSTFPRRPKDRSVHDIASARNHENNVHINPAIAAVTPLINALEGKSFSSEGECKADCDKTGTAVTNQFRQTLRDTQQQENNQ